MTSRSAWTVPGATQRSASERQLAAATLCAAAVVVLIGLWVCYLLVRLGDPGVAPAALGLTIVPHSLAAVTGGVLLHAHRPGSSAGWALIVFGASKIIPFAADAVVWLEQPGPAVRAAVLVLDTLANLVHTTLWYTLPLWFPQGRLTSRWWWLYVAAVALWMVPPSFVFGAAPAPFEMPNPLTDGWWGRTADLLRGFVGSTKEVTYYSLTGLGLAVLLARLRQGETRQRRRILLLVSGYVLMACWQSAFRYLNNDWLAFCLYLAGSLLWTATFAHYVVRTGSWRISRSARRMLAGLMVAALLTAAYVGAAAVLVTGPAFGETGNALVLVAVAFLLGVGLRRTMARATGLVDHLFYGDRAHPYQVLDTLATRISRTVGPEEIPDTLCATVVESLRLPGAVLAVHTQAGPRLLAAAGRVGPEPQHFDLLHQGATIGRLSVGPRDGERELDGFDTGILASLANQAAPALASLRLQEELRSSREQIVTAREEERRHLRRDIHDGLGPTLAGLRLRVENATLSLSAGDPVREALRGVSDGLGTAVTEVRRITEHLGPAPLVELGLTGALRQLVCAFDSARTRIDADLSPSFLPSLSAAVEVAAYRIAAEALTNVVRHARAAHARLRVRVDADRLTLTVLDDGIGIGPEPRHRGVGLRSMAERAAEIGGHCSIDRLSPGTRVCAVLPRSIGAVLHAPRETPAPGSSPDGLGDSTAGHRAHGAQR
ncbi:ATP-binding protein [Streptomyces sp. MN13]